MNTYFDAINAAQLQRDFPLGEAFVSTFRHMSREALRARQEAQWQRLMPRVWQIPFYQRLYGRHGIEPGDIRSLEDLSKLPTFSKADLMQSIAEYPPYGDFHGMQPGGREPVVLHTTSGTTGTPQVLLFGPKSREIQNLLLARIYLWQGLRPEDVVHSVYGFGMINGGHYIRETILHWTQARLLPAGTGVETPSLQQVTLMRAFAVTCLVGFPDYLKRLAEVARAHGIMPGSDIPVRMISGHLGRDSRDALSAAWGGAEVFDWYGVGDTGIIAGEGPDHAGLYVMEDAHYLELLDVDSGQPVPDGEEGDMVVTVLFKDDIYPIVRFNTHDVSAFETSASPLGLPLRRLRGFLGRSDNMVKLRGINVFPHAIGAMLAERPEFTGEFICRLERDRNGQDTLIVETEVTVGTEAYGHLLPAYRELLKSKLGLVVQVEFTTPGALKDLTGIESRQKPIRLLDNR